MLQNETEMAVATAAVWSGPAAGFTVGPEPIPQPAAGEVVVEVELATICGSDVHTIAGDRPTPVPTVLGHEAVGVVTATGGDVPAADGRPVRPGDRITWTIGTSCGNCRRCRRGVAQKCESVRKYGHEAMTDGWRLNGGLATHCHLAAGTGLVRVPAELPAAVVTPANCATATVVAAARRAGLAAGDAVVVIGCGMLGLTAIGYAAERGAASVVACDVDPRRRELAGPFGAAVACAPDELPAVAATYGADVVIEVSGNSAAVQTALEITGLNGCVALVGSVSPAPEVRFEPSSFVRNLSRLVGSHNYRVDDLVEAVDFLARTPLRDRFAGLVGESYPLAEIDAAVAAARTGSAPRIAVQMRSQA